MRRAVAAAVLSIAIFIGLRVWRSCATSKRAAPSVHAGSSDSVTKTAPPSQHVRKISSAERKQLLDRITAAREARAAQAAQAQTAPSQPKLPAKTALPLEQVGTHVLDALKEAIPFLAECYAQAGSGSAKRTAMAMMTLTGDPEIGTVIDADQIFDENHQPLDPAVDECLRNTMETLQLPPLEEGDSVKIQYSFAFD